MLVLSRKLGQSFHVGPEVRVTIVKIDRNSIRIGIEAPRGRVGAARGDRVRDASNSFVERRSRLIELGSHIPPQDKSPRLDRARWIEYACALKPEPLTRRPASQSGA